METEDTGSGKEDEPEVNSEQEEDDGSGGPSTSAGPNTQSNTRLMRNQAEKNRRDKLNSFITELSTLVPITGLTQKKLDKTSILRLAATYIRLHNVIFGPVRQGSPPPSTIQRQMLEYLPQALASHNWSEDVLQEMDGMLMIVNGAGSIIFISHTVEKLLGHTQIELMGQSLYNLTCLEDYDELKRNLSPDEDPNSTVATGDIDESSSDSSCPPPTPPIRQALMPPDSQHPQEQKQRRSFFVRLKQRAQSRGDQPQYVLVHIVGHLRVPPRRPQPSTSRSTSQPLNHNNIVLVAVVKPFQEKRITTLSLLEASREEFITRHTLDGRIVYTDHRISIVAGYLAEEVCGVPGFQYMHKEDFRWTMVGLRQMFYRGSSFGQSCYRLQTKTGKFIYLKTCGYLELSENNDSFQSLICINSLVSAQEGETLIQQMKDLYSPAIRSKEDRNLEILTSPIQGQTAIKKVTKIEEIKGETEDPKLLEEAINQMISNVPTQQVFLNSPSPSPMMVDMNEPSYTKAALYAKQMPPVGEQTKKYGICQVLKIPTRAAAVAASLSSPSSLHSQQSQHSPPMKGSPPPTHIPTPRLPTPPPAVPPPTQNRPSVLRKATKQGEQVSVLKLKKMRTDESGQEVVTVSPRSVVVSPSSSGSVCSNGKRKSEDTSDWSLPPPLPLQVDVAPPTLPPPPAPPSLSPTHFPIMEPLLPEFDVGTDLLSDLTMPDDASSPSLTSNFEEMCNGLGEFWSWGQQEIPEVLDRPEVLENSHRTLTSQIQLQGDQIQKIQEELEMVGERTNGSHQLYNSKLTQLQVEHRKQQQMLKTLQQLSSQHNVV